MKVTKIQCSLTPPQPVKEAAGRACSSSRPSRTASNQVGSSSTHLEVGSAPSLALNRAAANWVDSTAPYGYHAASKTFHQPTIATSLLNSLLANNEQKLAQIKLSKTVIAGGQTIGAGQDLAEVVRSHARDDKASVEVLAAVMDALGVQTQ